MEYQAIDLSNEGMRLFIVELNRSDVEDEINNHFIYHEFRFRFDDGLIIEWYPVDSLAYVDKYLANDIGEVNEHLSGNKARSREYLDTNIGEGSWTHAVLSRFNSQIIRCANTLMNEIEEGKDQDKWTTDMVNCLLNNDYRIHVFKPMDGLILQADPDSCGYYVCYFIYLSINELDFEEWKDLVQYSEIELELFNNISQMAKLFTDIRTESNETVIEPNISVEIPTPEKAMVQEAKKAKREAASSNRKRN